MIRLILKLTKDYNIPEEIVFDADKIINEITKKMNNGENITKDEIEDLLYTYLSDQRQFSKVEKLIYEEPTIKDYIESCTHRSLYEKFSNFEEKTIEDAIAAYNKILVELNNGTLTKDYLYNAFGMLNTDADEVLKELILKHKELAAIYETMY